MTEHEKVKFEYASAGDATALRIILGVVAIWSAIQVGFLAFAFTSSPPSPLAELMSTRRQTEYLASFGFHVFTILAFGVGAFTSNRAWVSFWEEGRVAASKGEDKASWFPVVAYLALTLFLLGIFIGSAVAPRYQVFVDLSSESVVRKDIHLLPPGMSEHTIRFGDITEISGVFVKHEPERYGHDAIEYHYSLGVLSNDGRWTEIGSGPAQKNTQEPDQGMFSLAQAIADISGAKVDLR